MAYTPHTWANGDSGANAPAWLNNMEEGVRAAMATAEETAEDYNPADTGSLYSRSGTLRTSANGKLGLAAWNCQLAQQEQLKLEARNHYLLRRNGTASTGAGQVITGNSTTRTPKFPLGTNNTQYFRVGLSGYYLIMINGSICGPNATVRIRKNFATIETLKLMDFQDLSFAQERAIVSTSVIRQFAANDAIDFTIDQDGDGSSLMGFRVLIRKV